MRLAIIIPCLNEQQHIVETLQPLQRCRAEGVHIIVVDGGSTDDTVSLAEPLADQVLTASKGRALQMNAGAAACESYQGLLFLHADTVLPAAAVLTTVPTLLVSHPQAWGRFNVRLSGKQWLLRVVEWAINQRSCFTGIATGDQAMFMTRQAFEQAGGFPDIPLMEDVALSHALKRLHKPVCLKTQVLTSSRRWEQRGIVRTIVLMWSLRLAYTLGVSPQRLQQYYQ